MGVEKAMRVVVIEDNHDLNEMLVEDLRSAGYETLGFNSVEAFEVSGLDADILLLDINLPGKTGLEFAVDVRSRDKHIGLVVLSARTGSHNRISGYQAGVDVYLQKPVASQELLAAVDRVAERVNLHRGGTANQGSRCALTIDRLLFSGPKGEVLLSAREVKVLAAMTRSDDQYVSYDACKLLYAQGGPVKDAALGVAIGRLRKKIASVSDVQQPIVAVGGEGYKLIIDVKIE